MAKNIDVSFVMTVYNKEYYLPSVIKALLAQSGIKNAEYIFVDDVSTDNSVDIIRQMTKGIDGVKIVTNEHNRGISARTNQGISLANGKWTRLLDSDDIFPIDSTEKMLALAEKLNADIIYGCFAKTGKEPTELTNCFLEDYSYTYDKIALRGLLNGRYTRMGQLIKTDVLKKCAGADERAFIQDESLPLRAAMCADGIIKMSANVVLVPKEVGNFSGNKTQLDHDRFMAYYWAIKEAKKLPPKYLWMMYKRALSAYWKYVKKNKSMPYFRKIFWAYINCKTTPQNPNIAYLDSIYKELSALGNIRRIKE